MWKSSIDRLTVNSQQLIIRCQLLGEETEERFFQHETLTKETQDLKMMLSHWLGKAIFEFALVGWMDWKRGGWISFSLLLFCIYFSIFAKNTHEVTVAENEADATINVLPLVLLQSYYLQSVRDTYQCWIHTTLVSNNSSLGE